MELGDFIRGEALPSIRRTYRPQDLFLFSAATWNAHRVHYDQKYVVDVEGHESLLVHGPFQAVQMFQVLVGALTEQARVRSVHYRHLNVLYVGEEVAMSGRLVGIDPEGTTATFAMWVERVNDGQRTTTGSATVQLTSAD